MLQFSWRKNTLRLVVYLISRYVAIAINRCVIKIKATPFCFISFLRSNIANDTASANNGCF